MLLKELISLNEEVKKMAPLTFLKKVVMPKIKTEIGATSVIEAIPSHLNLRKNHVESNAYWEVIDGEEKKKLKKFSEDGVDSEGDKYTWEVVIHECRGVKIAEIYLFESGPGEDSTYVFAKTDADKFKN